MDKASTISQDFINTRVDKWVKKNISNVPQSLIEKNLRNKNITVNRLRVKSSYKLKINDIVYLKGFNPKINKSFKKKSIYLTKKT